MKKLMLFILFLLPFVGMAQVDTIALIKESNAFQQELNKEYKDKSTSPLLPGDLKKFKQHGLLFHRCIVCGSSTSYSYA